MRKPVFWGFPTRYDSNQPAQLQGLARVLKSFISKYRYYSIQAANNKGADQTVPMCRLICVFVVCILNKAGFLIMWLISVW